MFQLANFVLILVASSNLWGVLAGTAPSVRQIATELIGVPGGLERLRAALVVSCLAQVYLVALVFPLKAIDRNVGLAWSILMLLSVVETIHTTRKMYATAAGDRRDVRFPLHDSVYYRAYQVLFSVATIAACGLLLWPRA